MARKRNHPTNFGDPMSISRFLEELRVQRWDDHRFYHHCRINQSLHLVSALSFLCAYALLFVEPAWSALLAWCVSMTTRQAGHFFFEPRGYDTVNQVTDEYKEEVKVGYNIRRKIVLMSVWAFMPVALIVDPSLGGNIEPAVGLLGYAHDVGLAWLALGVAGLVFRVLQLWQQQSLMTGLVWGTKIITDPFHDVYLYHKAPLALLRGERYDPMTHVHHS
ncbi:MAG: hypothetical protein RL500_1181 [Pseudomonadota bacterium]|jgi:hypothetical protein